MPRPTRFKHAIYESATKLFGERGVSGTGIREIARQAGVSEAALYRHWKGKQQLARDIFVQGMADLHAGLVAEVPMDGPVSSSVLATVRIFFEAFDENPDVFHYVVLSEHEVWRTIDSQVPNPVTFWFDLLRGRAVDFDLPPELSNECLGPITLGMILRPSIAAAYGSVAQPLAQHAPTVARAICRVIGVPWTPPNDSPEQRR